MKNAQPIDNPIPAGDCWFEVYNPYEHLEAEPPKPLPVALSEEEARALAKKKKAEQTRQARAAKRASPYLQNKFQTSKVLQKKLKAIFDE